MLFTLIVPNPTGRVLSSFRSVFKAAKMAAVVVAAATPPAPSFSKHPTIKKDDVIVGRFKILKLLGQGGFGAVFQVEDSKTKELEALKIELQHRADSQILLEAGVLQRMQGKFHYPKFVADGKHGIYRFAVMQLVGDNLSDIKKQYPGRKFTMNTSLQLGLQCIEAIQELHSSSFIHRDVKPANFCHGLNADLHKIYLLDYGLVRRYKTKGGQIRKERKFAAFRGTIKYASVNALLNIDYGRIDDIYSWVYMLVEFVKGDLPWHAENDRAKVTKQKIKSKDTLFNDLPIFRDYFDRLTKLRYADEPPYDFFKDTLKDMLIKNPPTSKVKTPPTTKNVVEPFDWEEGGFYYKYVRPTTETVPLGAGTDAVKDEALKSAADERTTIIEGPSSNTPKSAG